MNKLIQLKNIINPQEIIMLDTDLATFTALPNGSPSVQGSYSKIDGDELGVFADGGNLFFQWNKQRWNFKDLSSKIRYGHDFKKKLTTFSVEDRSIQYPSWWADDPTFDPSVPERDEDEDFFAYVASLASNDGLQKILINSWNK
jgi:hypothetical protein